MRLKNKKKSKKRSTKSHPKKKSAKTAPKGLSEGSKKHHFKKGNPGGPGRPKLDMRSKELLKKARACGQELLETLIDTINANKTQEALNKLTPKTKNTKEAIACAIITKMVRTGDWHCFNFILERTIGKVKDESIVFNQNLPEGIDISKLDDIELETLKNLMLKSKGNDRN